MTNLVGRIAIAVCVLFIAPATSSEKPSSQCSDCPVDINVGADRSCDTAPVTKGRGWVTISWREVPVIDWSCEDLSVCDIGDCSQCSSFVEIQLVHICSPEVLAKHQPGYGLDLDYADPLVSYTLRNYLAPPVRVPDSL